MFIKYSLTIPWENGSKTQSIDIIDDDFQETIIAPMTNLGMDIMTPVIAVYERRGLNVGVNIVKALVYMSERFGLERKFFLDQMCKVNKNVARYRDDVDKYLALL